MINYNYYRKRDSEIKAIQYKNNIKEIIDFAQEAMISSYDEEGNMYYMIKTPIGDIRLHNNDYVTENYQGEFGVYRPEVFEHIYEMNVY